MVQGTWSQFRVHLVRASFRLGRGQKAELQRAPSCVGAMMLRLKPGKKLAQLLPSPDLVAEARARTYSHADEDEELFCRGWGPSSPRCFVYVVWLL